jgi:hypothetical protein
MQHWTMVSSETEKATGGVLLLRLLLLLLSMVAVAQRCSAMMSSKSSLFLDLAGMALTRLIYGKKRCKRAL